MALDVEGVLDGGLFSVYDIKSGSKRMRKSWLCNKEMAFEGIIGEGSSVRWDKVAVVEKTKLVN